MVPPRRFCRVLVAAAAALALLPAPLVAGAAGKSGEEKAVVLAGKYFRTDKSRSFAKQAKRIGGDSVYQPLVAYWQSMMALRRNKPQAALDYLQSPAASPYYQQQAREKLLGHYAKKNEWQLFRRHAAGGGQCAERLSANLAGAPDAAATRALWWGDGKMNAPLCLTLYRHAYRTGLLTKDDVWTKLRALAGNRQLGASRRLLSNFRGFIRYKTVRSVVRRATRYIRQRHGLRNRAGRELVMIAAMAAARRNPKTAIGRWQKFSQYFSADENDHVWTVLATWAARWHRDDALQLYERSSGKYGDEQSRAWFVRAALRAGDYARVLQGIDEMPAGERNLSAWRYWRAIALQRQNDAAAATAALAELARDEDDFYGLLAREAIGQRLIDSKPPPPDAEVGGDFALALALHRAGMTTSARAVWRHAARHADATDAELIAAAQQAARADWPLASIDAALRADDAAAHHLRFPFPYRDHIAAHSAKRGLDLAFVYGLIHQESRFMPKIVSSAKARGLMQVIPRTARQVARANGYSKYRLSRLTRVDTNITIGTTYLHTLASDLGAEPMKVAAGYNAGPRRVNRWRKASPDILVAIENIPITETRLYVKYLLANRLHYTVRLGREAPSMSENIRRPIMTTPS